MKIVFDTNVLLSAFLTTSGLSRHVFKLALKRSSILLSGYILQEAKEKMTGKLGFPPEKTARFIDFLQRKTTVVRLETNVSIPFSDEKDRPILHLLQTYRPHYLVTGDKKLLQLKKFGATLIASPREIVEILEHS
ncbi:MAG: putative toxin-antitoxin system toxin component, PIN family [Candidatus Omnitrophica bacterium]|nr:putative toxin-antitoxin system toxin component, PIN family [Candidatus Omnitrophota bacterium]